MQLSITGKNIDIGNALREHVRDRIENNVLKYFDGVVSSHVTVEKQRSAFHTDCVLHLSTGLTLQAQGEGGDAYSSADVAIEHLQKRMRRYKRRLKDHHLQRGEPISLTPAASYVIAAHEVHEDEEPDSLSPTIIAEDNAHIPELSVGEAVMQLDISDSPVVLFRNTRHGQVNVVYRRKDGHIGWVDPQHESSD